MSRADSGGEMGRQKDGRSVRHDEAKFQVHGSVHRYDKFE